MASVAVCPADELPPGERLVVTVGGRSIGVFNVDGTIYAVRNVCPHQGAELCRGTVGGTMIPSEPYVYEVGLEGRVLRCPWHGWEFDLSTGAKLFHPSSTARVRTYAARIEDGTVFVDA